MMNVLWFPLSCGRSYNVLVYDRVAFNNTPNAFIHNYWKKKLLLYSGSKFLIVGWKLIFSWKWDSPEYLFWCFITYRYWTKVLSVLSILFWNRHKWWKKLSFINDDSCCIITRLFLKSLTNKLPLTWHNLALISTRQRCLINIHFGIIGYPICCDIVVHNFQNPNTLLNHNDF